MNHQPVDPADPAAVFACALALWRDCMRLSHRGTEVNLSECYNGADEFMRVIMRVGTSFEEWACRHVDFERLDLCWPYLLEERFGEACLAVKGLTSLDDFCDDDCIEVARRLRLPVKVDGHFPIPVDEHAANPVADSDFRSFRIKTMRQAKDGSSENFTPMDDPFDTDYGPPYFALYGVCAAGLPEHVSDLRSYSDAVHLVRKLAPGIRFPETPAAR